ESYNAYEQHQVTSVKNQNPFGTCWSFAALNSVEASMIRNGVMVNESEVDATNLDLAERHLAYFFFHSVEDPFGNAIGDQMKCDDMGTKYLYSGGDYNDAGFTLLNWYGAVDEASAPYQIVESKFSLNDEIAYDGIGRVQNIFMVNIAERDLVKNLIMEYGAAATCYYAPDTDDCYDDTNAAFYCDWESAINHAVSIIGWDDNFPIENFKEGRRPEQPGAWLIKNSWGTGYGKNGFMWISYEDKTIDGARVFDAYSREQYDKNYHYDGTASYQTRRLAANAKTANVFQVSTEQKNQEELKAVGVGFHSANVKYQVDIYVNPTEEGDPESGILAASKEYTTSYEGFYTVSLDEPVKLKPGDRFAVVVTNKTSEAIEIYVDKTINFDWSGLGNVTYYNATEEGQSFIDLSGNANWYDMESSPLEELSGETPRIKAYTKLLDLVDIETNCDASFLNDVVEYTYTGQKIEPQTALTLKEGATPLVLNQDYTVTFRNNRYIGIAEAVFKGCGDYSGTIVKEFSIEPISLLNAVVTQEQESKEYEYTTKPVTPQVRVEVEGKELNLNEDYTVSYIDNIERKEIQQKDSVIRIKGIGNYQGELFENFSIVKSSLERVSMTLEYKQKQWKTQTEFCPKVTVKDGTKILKNGTDYTVSYADNTEPGDGKVIITAVDSDICNYSGTKEATFQITGKPIKDTKVTLSQTSFIYDGTEHTPAVTVMDGKKTLEPQTDYVLFYRNCQSAGKATVLIQGIGLYAGEREVTYQIKGIDVSKLKAEKIPDQIYLYGDEIKPVNDIVLKDKATGTKIDLSNFRLGYDNNVKVGTATVYITGKEQYSGTRKLTFKIVKKTLTDADTTVKIGEHYVEEQYAAAYSGQKICPDVIVEVGGHDLQKGTDYTVSYTNHLNVAEADIRKAPTIIITGKGNYKGSIKRTFSIKPRPMSSEEIMVTVADARYNNGKALSPKTTVTYIPMIEGTKSILLKKGRDYTITYMDETGDPNELSYGRVIIQGTGNYTGTLGDSEDPQKQIRFKISNKVLADRFIVTGVQPVTYHGGEQLQLDEGQKSTVKVYEKRNMPELVEGEDYRLEFYNNINAGIAKMKIIGMGEYAGEKTVTFKILPRNLQTTLLDDLIQIEEIEAQPYSGYACTPDTTVTDYGLAASEELLTEGIDYTLSYQNNVNPTNEKSKASVIIAGKGNYKGRIRQNFVIEPIEFSSATICVNLQDEIVYNAKAQTPAITIINDDNGVQTVLNNKAAFDIKYLNNKEVGKATIQLYAKGKGWRETSKQSNKILQTHFAIIKGDLSDSSITTISDIPKQTYKGYQVKPSVKVKVNGVILKKDRDYILHYTGNQGPNFEGNGAHVSIIGIGNYTGEARQYFRIY
ncbi:MAG: hypothetical protein GX567_09515, partial [Clostridia bacterium]|nr:hypothetical protein [Clostridia bacterium]